MRRLLEVGALARPRIRVERIVLVAPEHVAAETLCTALGDESQLAGRRTSILGLIVRCQHLHFGDRVEVLRAHHETAGLADADRRRTIDGRDELIGAPTVDRGHAGRKRTDTGRHRTAHAAANDAWRQLRDLCSATSAEWRFGNLFAAHRAADHRGIDERRRGLDLNRLAERPDFERHVNANVQTSVDLYAGFGDRLETGEHRGHLVLADRYVGECIEAGFVGHSRACDLRPDAGERDVDTRQNGAGGVLHHTGDGGRVELCVRRRRTHQQHTDNTGDAPGHAPSKTDIPKSEGLIAPPGAKSKRQIVGAISVDGHECNRAPRPAVGTHLLPGPA